MRNDRLDEAQAGIEISGRNINNLRYADDTTLTAESEEEPESLLMRVKRSWRASSGEESGRGEWKRWLETHHSEKIVTSGPIPLRQTDGETMETVTDYFLGLQNHCRKAMTNQYCILKSRDIALLIKVHIVKIMVFLVVMYGCESWTIKTEHQRTDAFQLFNCGVGVDSWESLGLHGDQT